MSTNSDARDIIDSVQTLAGPTEIDPEKHYVMPVAGEGSVEFILPAEEALLAAPRRIRGTTAAYDADTFGALCAKYGTAATEVFGDPGRFTFTAVLNADAGSDAPAFRDHRVELPLRHTKAWIAWTGIDGKMLSQVEFAEFIEARMGDVTRPSGAEMLELATTLEQSSAVQFKSAVALGSGVRSLTYEETATARAGETGQLEIPKDIEIGVAPFEDGDAFRVTARFRYRIRSGQLSLGVVLDRPEDVVKEAFSSFSEQIAQAADRTVLLGSPPKPTLQS